MNWSFCKTKKVIHNFPMFSLNMSFKYQNLCNIIYISYDSTLWDHDELCSPKEFMQMRLRRSEVRLAIINCKRRTGFAPTKRSRCCGWIFGNYFFGTFRRPNCMAIETQNLKADPSCHNMNVFQIGTRVNVSFTRVLALFKVKPSRGTNNSSLL